MKRFPYPILWSIVASCALFSPFIFETRSRAQTLTTMQVVTLEPEVRHGRKVSDDLLKKVADGKGAEFVRVVIQPANQADVAVDSAIETTGASDIRKLKNLKVRIATLPVQAAVNL